MFFNDFQAIERQQTYRAGFSPTRSQNAGHSREKTAHASAFATASDIDSIHGLARQHDSPLCGQQCPSPEGRRPPFGI